MESKGNRKPYLGEILISIQMNLPGRGEYNGKDLVCIEILIRLWRCFFQEGVRCAMIL